MKHLHHFAITLCLVGVYSIPSIALQSSQALTPAQIEAAKKAAAAQADAARQQAEAAKQAAVQAAAAAQTAEATQAATSKLNAQSLNPWFASKATTLTNTATSNVLNTSERFGVYRAIVQSEQAAKEKVTPPPCVQATASIQSKSDASQSVKADGTYQPFAAIFDVLGSFSDAGNGAVPSAQSGVQTQLFGHLDWESQHFNAGSEFDGDCKEINYKQNIDFSFGGMIGLYPALVMENISSTTAAIAQPKNRPMFQDSFRWTLGPRVNYPVYDHGEVSGFANIGQTFLIDQVTSFKEGDDSFTATPVANNTGRAAFFTEGGVQFKMYSDPVWLAHDNKSTLDPFFTVGGGVRKDTRFSAAGDLAGFLHPQDRLFFQFLINLTSIKPSSFSSDVKPAPPASVRFGIDMEKPIDDSRIPTATRFYVSANLNIMSVFRPTSNSSATPQ